MWRWCDLNFWRRAREVKATQGKGRRRGISALQIFASCTKLSDHIYILRQHWIYILQQTDIYCVHNWNLIKEIASIQSCDLYFSLWATPRQGRFRIRIADYFIGQLWFTFYSKIIHLAKYFGYNLQIQLGLLQGKRGSKILQRNWLNFHFPRRPISFPGTICSFTNKDRLQAKPREGRCPHFRFLHPAVLHRIWDTFCNKGTILYILQQNQPFCVNTLYLLIVGSAK